MLASIVFNGVTYQIPLPGDTSGWGTILDTLFSGLAAGAAGKNVANTFTAKQTLSAGLALGSQSAPTQAVTAQVYAGTDGNVYAIPATGNAATPIALTSILGGIPLASIAQGGASSGNVMSWNGTTWAPSGAGAGSVTSVGLAAPAIFSVSGSPVTSSGTLTLALTTQVANRVWAGPATGADAIPTFRALVSADINAVNASIIDSGTLPAARLAGSYTGVTGVGTLTAGTWQAGIVGNTYGGTGANLSATSGYWKQATSGAVVVPVATIPSTDISGLITSVGLSLPAIFSVSGSPITSGAGTLTGTLATQTANTVWAGPTTGAAAAPTFRAHVADDIPATLNATSMPTINLTSSGSIKSSGTTIINFLAGDTYIQPQTSATGNIYLLSNLGTAFLISPTAALFSNGSAATPGLALINSTTTGFYRGGTNILGFTTAGVSAGTIDASGNWAIAPAAANTVQIGGTSKLLAPADGQLQVAKSTVATAPTTLVSGLIIGPKSSSGVSLVFDSTMSGNVGLRAMNGDQSANLGFNALAFGATTAANVNFGINVGIAGQTGMGHPTTTSIGWYVSNTQYGLVDANGQWSNLRQLAAAKTANYTIVANDSGTMFTNTAAAGSVQFTLPTVAAGLWYDFVVSAAQTVTVISGSGSPNISGPALTGSTRTVNGAAAQFTSFRIRASAGGSSWYITDISGTVT